jgi:electron transfer flavoprotein alpha subunit
MAELWIWLDDEDGRAGDVPGRLAGEGARLAETAGLTPRGVTRGRAAAARLVQGGAANGLGVISALEETHADASAGIAGALCAAITQQQPQVMLFPATATGTDIAGRVAAGLGRALLGACVDIEWQQDGLRVRREIYGKRAHQVLSPLGPPPWVVSLDVAVLHANDLPAAKPAIEDLAVAVATAEGAAPGETWRLAARELDVSDADLVFSVGKGVAAEHVLPAVFRLAELLDGAVGGSREAVFANMIARERQVGASGKWIAPRVYVALGISGSSYHLMGIKEAKYVAAVNIDPNAPIFERAQWVGIADLARVVPAMVDACERGRD